MNLSIYKKINNDKSLNENQVTKGKVLKNSLSGKYSKTIHQGVNKIQIDNFLFQLHGCDPLVFSLIWPSH